MKEIAYHLHQAGERIGMIMLEEAPKRTLLGMVGIHMNRNLLVDQSDVSEEDIRTNFDDLFGPGRTRSTSMTASAPQRST